MNSSRFFKTGFTLIFLLSHMAMSPLFSQDLEVAPIRVNFNIAPGETQSRTVAVKNHSNRKETVTMRIQDFLVQRTGEREMLSGGSTRNTIANWITVSPAILELEPNEERTVQLTLQAPVDDYRSRWGVMSFATAVEQPVFSADRDLQTGVTISGRIDIFLSYNPAGGDPGRLEISNLRETESSNPEERRFQVNLENVGERIINGRVFLIASNLQTASEERFRTVEVATYPQTMRTVELTLPATLPPGRYSLAAILDYPGSASLKGTQIIIDVE